MRNTDLKATVAEGLGSALLLAVVVGSGIMGERLAAGNVAIALLANSIATGSGLAVLILMYGPVSGAHFNPVVTIAGANPAVTIARSLTDTFTGIRLSDVPGFLLGQFTGMIAATVRCWWISRESDPNLTGRAESR